MTAFSGYKWENNIQVKLLLSNKFSPILLSENLYVEIENPGPNVLMQQENISFSF